MSSTENHFVTLRVENHLVHAVFQTATAFEICGITASLSNERHFWHVQVMMIAMYLTKPGIFVRYALTRGKVQNSFLCEI